MHLITFSFGVREVRPAQQLFNDGIFNNYICNVSYAVRIHFQANCGLKKTRKLQWLHVQLIMTYEYVCTTIEILKNDFVQTLQV